MQIFRNLTYFLIISLSLVFSSNALATKIGYSGRLVQADGTPISGTPNLQFDLYYSNDLATSLATQTVNSVSLSNGIYTVELDFPTLATLIANTPASETLVIQVRDTTNSLTFDYQNILATPIASYAVTAESIADAAITPQSLDFVGSCADNQILIKNGSQFDCINQTAALSIDSTLVNNAGTIGQATVGTAGTYTSVTVDAYGRVTAGTNPTPAIGSGEITNDSIMDADINSAANISWSKINVPTIDKTYVGLSNVANVAQIPASDLDNSGTLDSATQVPSELAVKGYVDTFATNVADGKVINSMAGTETTQAPSVDSVKTYVDARATQWSDNGSDIYFNSGRVGIGTSSPVAPIELSAPGSSNYSAGVTSQVFGLPEGTAMYLEDNTVAAEANKFIGIGFSGVGPGGARRSAHIGAVTAGSTHRMELVFGQKLNNTSYLERMRIDKDGNVGIGTSSPISELHVAAPTGGTSNILLNLESYGNVNYGRGASIQFNAPSGSGSSKLSAQIHGGNDSASYSQVLDFKVHDGSDFNSVLTLEADQDAIFKGNIGVGTATPSEKLDVVGKVKGTELCIGADCRAAWPSGAGSGTVTDITAGTGLTGGTITTSGTINVDVGTTNGQIAQVGAGDKLADSIINYNPAIDVALTGFTTGAASTILATDTILQAFSKVQGQINAQTSALAGATSDSAIRTAVVVNSTAGSETDQAASVAAMKSYVLSETSAINESQWTTTGSDIFYNTGAVGIGTNNPDHSLEVKGVNSSLLKVSDSTGNQVMRLIDTGNELQLGPDSDKLSLKHNGVAASLSGTRNSTAIGQLTMSGYSSDGLITLDSSEVRLRSGDGSINKFIVRESGNVGIGTATPSAPLEVDQTVSGVIAIFGTGDGDGSGAKIWTSSDSGALSLYDSFGNEDIRFATHSAAVSYIKQGTVGIGTDTPTEKLTVAGNINVTTGNDICIDGAGCLSSAVSGGGETNTASSAGGTSLVLAKSGTDLPFKGLTSTSDISLTANTNDVQIGVTTSNGAGELLRLDGSGRVPASNVMSTPLTGYSVGANAVLAPTDTIVDAYGKLQAQINANYTAITGLSDTDDLAEGATNLYFTNTRAQTAAVVNSTAGSETDQAASVAAMKSYVAGEVSGASSQWTTTGSDIYYSSGKVGVGTSSPSTTLTVSGDSTVWGKHEIDYTGTNDALHVHQEGTGNLLSLSTGAGWDQKVVVDNLGYLGVGTDNPSKLLHVASDDSTAGIVIERSSNDTEPSSLIFGKSREGGAVLQNDGLAQMYVAAETDTTTEVLDVMRVVASENFNSTSTGYGIEFSTAANGTTAESVRMKIANDGNVGIGVLGSVSYKLHVNGTVAGSGAYVNASDERFKKDYEDIDYNKSALDKLLNIKGRYFYWRNDEFPDYNFTDERDLGVIAQEVQKEFPEAVSVNKETGYMSVAYSKLVAPIIESIRELFNQSKSDKEELTREIASLKDDLENQKKENEVLKAYLCEKDPDMPLCPKN